MSFLGLFAGGACGPASALLRGFTRSPLVTRWRNPGAPKKLDRSNKGKQQWFKGRGVGLHGALNKQGTRAHSEQHVIHRLTYRRNAKNYSDISGFVSMLSALESPFRSLQANTRDDRAHQLAYS